MALLFASPARASMLLNSSMFSLFGCTLTLAPRASPMPQRILTFWALTLPVSDGKATFDGRVPCPSVPYRTGGGECSSSLCPATLPALVEDVVASGRKSYPKLGFIFSPLGAERSLAEESCLCPKHVFQHYPQQVHCIWNLQSDEDRLQTTPPRSVVPLSHCMCSEHSYFVGVPETPAQQRGPGRR